MRTYTPTPLWHTIEKSSFHTYASNRKIIKRMYKLIIKYQLIQFIDK